MLTDGLSYKGLENWTGVLQTQHPYRFAGRTCGFCASLVALGVIAVKLSGEWWEARYSQVVIYQSQCPQRCSLHKAHCRSPHLQCIDGIPEGQCPMNDLDALVSSARVDSRQLGNLSSLAKKLKPEGF
jgi:hypothetical protein